jgi:hypothetical protein
VTGEVLFTLHLPAGTNANSPVEGETRVVRVTPGPPAPGKRVGPLVTVDGVFADAWNVSLAPHPLA